LIPLPKPSVDTGMGLERIAAVMQGVHSNYEIDLFQTLLKAASEITGERDLSRPSLQVIADHIRSCAFLIVDGVTPSNEGRGYVLRRIVRRAVRHGYQLGLEDIFFHRLVGALVEAMGEAYPELVERQDFVEKVLREEEQQFARTLEHGMKILEQAIEKLDGTVLPGETVFKLYDTFGFPVDLTADVAREHDLTLDMDGFDKAMEVQRAQARSASSFGALDKLVIDLVGGTEFVGYDDLNAPVTIAGMYRDGNPTQSIDAPAAADLILNNSPFYGESGGQIGDRGVLEAEGILFEVEDTQKQGEFLVHRGRLVRGRLSIGDQLTASVAADSRAAITLNHSATHLMHAALRQVLGNHVTQKGSLVTAERLRFDFSHPLPMAPEELRAVEELVNREILENSEVSKEVMSMDEARSRGAMALFGEKYGDQVRVVSMGEQFSTELCGGCHVRRTGDIGFFKIVSEAGIAAGVRRIEAVTGKGALELVSRRDQTLVQLGEIVKASEDSLVEKVRQLSSHSRALEKQLEQLKAKMASSTGSDLASEARDVNGVKLLAAKLEGFNAKALRDTVDQLKNKLGKCSVIVLASEEEDKVSLVVGVTQDLTDTIKAGELVNMVAGHVGGKGGGRPDMAMAGGNNPAGIPVALQSVEPWLSERT